MGGTSRPLAVSKLARCKNMAMSCSGNKGLRAEINMTPMIDVLLVLRQR
jgi:hypothetical protein